VRRVFTCHVFRLFASQILKFSPTWPLCHIVSIKFQVSAKVVREPKEVIQNRKVDAANIYSVPTCRVCTETMSRK
jgi:hypothetical protein